MTCQRLHERVHGVLLLFASEHLSFYFPPRTWKRLLAIAVFARVCAFDKVGSKRPIANGTPATVSRPMTIEKQNLKDKNLIDHRGAEPFAERARKYLIDGLSVSLYQAINKFNRAIYTISETC